MPSNSRLLSSLPVWRNSGTPETRWREGCIPLHLHIYWIVFPIIMIRELGEKSALNIVLSVRLDAPITSPTDLVTEEVFWRYTSHSVLQCRFVKQHPTTPHSYPTPSIWLDERPILAFSCLTPTQRWRPVPCCDTGSRMAFEIHLLAIPEPFLCTLPT